MIDMRKFDVAIAAFTFSKKWKTVSVTWPDIVKKLKKTIRTTETVAHYHRLAKDGKRGKAEQHKIKDVGGFVGGMLTGGNRSKSTILSRSLLTLDLDNVHIDTNEVWELFQSALTQINGAPVASIMYSTHTHTPESPRLRLIVPLADDVNPTQYIAIGRKLAEMVGIEMFDRTTYQPERFMFWPSTPSDGEYIYLAAKGAYLSPDDVLGLYTDWNNVNEWPLSQAESKIIAGTLEKQQDPTEKTGIIGAFCRTYGIAEAIDKFLSDIYEISDVPGRYTYTAGSSYNGLAVYDNKFAYSHHNTDPAGGQCCNAFDLIRLHKYGALDENAKEGTNTNKLPSYQAMTDFCVKDKAVKIQLGKEKLNEARANFDDLLSPEAFKDSPEPENISLDDLLADYLNDEAPDSQEGIPEALTPEILDDDNKDWLGTMKVDKQGKYLCTTDNFLKILTHDKNFKNIFALDLFSMRIVARRPLNWRGKHNQVKGSDTPENSNFEILVNVNEDINKFINDDDLAQIRWYIETVYEIPYSEKKLEDAISVCAQRAAFHPIRDFLKGLEWDGVERIKYLFHDYLGAENTEYTRAVSVIFFTAAVARIFNPGCKFDYMPVLVGDQGISKSSFIKSLAGAWFSDSLFSMGDKSSYEQIQGSWIIEVAELSAMRKSDVDSIKHFIAKPTDKFRPAFGRMLKDFPRMCVFVGTVNNLNFLKDDTGNRRFWPILLSVVDAKFSLRKNFTEAERRQIWAEAYALYAGGQKLYLSAKMELEAAKIQNQFTEIDERIGMVEDYVNTLVPYEWDEMYPMERRTWYIEYQKGTHLQKPVLKRDRICAHAIAQELFGTELKYCTNAYIRQINNMLKNVKGLTPERLKFTWYGRQRGFIIQ